MKPLTEHMRMGQALKRKNAAQAIKLGQACGMADGGLLGNAIKGLKERSDKLGAAEAAPVGASVASTAPMPDGPTMPQDPLSAQLAKQDAARKAAAAAAPPAPTGVIGKLKAKLGMANGGLSDSMWNQQVAGVGLGSKPMDNPLGGGNFAGPLAAETQKQIADTAAYSASLSGAADKRIAGLSQPSIMPQTSPTTPVARAASMSTSNPAPTATGQPAALPTPDPRPGRQRGPSQSAWNYDSSGHIAMADGGLLFGQAGDMAGQPKLGQGVYINGQFSEYAGAVPRLPHPQQTLADGGFVLDPNQRNDMLGATPRLPTVQQTLCNGGRVKKMSRGGPVRGPGGPTEDKIPAMLSAGEYVLPADTVAKLGASNLDAIKDATHTPVKPGNVGAPVAHLAEGGSAVEDLVRMGARPPAPALDAQAAAEAEAAAQAAARRGPVPAVEQRWPAPPPPPEVHPQPTGGGTSAADRIQPRYDYRAAAQAEAARQQQFVRSAQAQLGQAAQDQAAMARHSRPIPPDVPNARMNGVASPEAVQYAQERAALEGKYAQAAKGAAPATGAPPSASTAAPAASAPAPGAAPAASAASAPAEAAGPKTVMGKATQAAKAAPGLVKQGAGWVMDKALKAGTVAAGAFALNDSLEQPDASSESAAALGKSLKPLAPAMPFGGGAVASFIPDLELGDAVNRGKKFLANYANRLTAGMVPSLQPAAPAPASTAAAVPGAPKVTPGTAPAAPAAAPAAPAQRTLADVERDRVVEQEAKLAELGVPRESMNRSPVNVLDRGAYVRGEVGNKTIDRTKYMPLGDYGAPGTQIFGRASTPGGKVNDFVGVGGGKGMTPSGVDFGLKPGEAAAYGQSLLDSADARREALNAPVYRAPGISAGHAQAQANVERLAQQMKGATSRREQMMLGRAMEAAQHALAGHTGANAMANAQAREAFDAESRNYTAQLGVAQKNKDRASHERISGNELDMRRTALDNENRKFNLGRADNAAALRTQQSAAERQIEKENYERIGHRAKSTAQSLALLNPDKYGKPEAQQGIEGHYSNFMSTYTQTDPKTGQTRTFSQLPIQDQKKAHAEGVANAIITAHLKDAGLLQNTVAPRTSSSYDTKDQPGGGSLGNLLTQRDYSFLDTFRDGVRIGNLSIPYKDFPVEAQEFLKKRAAQDKE
jgi:hypothetical protein